MKVPWPQCPLESVREWVGETALRGGLEKDLFPPFLQLLYQLRLGMPDQRGACAWSGLHEFPPGIAFMRLQVGVTPESHIQGYSKRPKCPLCWWYGDVPRGFTLQAVCTWTKNTDIDYYIIQLPGSKSWLPVTCNVSPDSCKRLFSVMGGTWQSVPALWHQGAS